MSETHSKTETVRREWKDRLLILGHHYQRSSVLRNVDAIGDSLELARNAASHPEAERIVFCGVRFMAESADILTRPDQQVYMPEPSAGCPMANMADEVSMQKGWNTINTAIGKNWVPVVYVNSTASIKALCGKLGGITCTSSNAGRAFRWVFEQGKRVFFLPDEHLGRNTAYDTGIPDNEVAVYDPKAEKLYEMNDPEAIKVVVWKGFCLVHTAFKMEHVKNVRSAIPDAKIIVHPEAPRDVVRASDAHGSTSQIIKYVESAPDGATIVIGTESNLVERLADEHKGRVTIKALSPSVCSNMSKTSEESLLELLTTWPGVCRVRVQESVVRDAGKALRRMLEI